MIKEGAAFFKKSRILLRTSSAFIQQRPKGIRSRPEPGQIFAANLLFSLSE
jgi:hypothetical protein